jgi:hypothetical protein
MQGSRLGLIAAVALLAGTAGCSLPQVLPLEGGTTAGPSPYGVWYEQHWATNSVLLAAADQPEEEVAPAPEASADKPGEPEVAITPDPNEPASEYTSAPMDDDAAAAAAEARAAADAAAAEANAPVEAQHAADGAQFDNSSPYQFPSSSFQPGAQAGQGTPPPANGPIRY